MVEEEEEHQGEEAFKHTVALKSLLKTEHFYKRLALIELLYYFGCITSNANTKFNFPVLASILCAFVLKLHYESMMLGILPQGQKN